MNIIEFDLKIYKFLKINVFGSHNDPMYFIDKNID